MSKIRICALGGLNEDGKNLYVIEVDNDIFVFDCGLKFDTGNLGVDYIIPDFTYLKSNVKKIKGVFLTHGHDENIGAIPHLLKEIPNLKIYGTKYTLIVLNRLLEPFEIKKANLIEMKPDNKITLGKCSVFPVKVTHSVPDAVALVLNTPDGGIVYTSNYTFDFASAGAYKADIGKLAYIGKQNVLCVLGESKYADKEGHTSPKHRLTNIVSETLRKNKGRIIFNTYPSQLFRLNEILKEIGKTNRRVVFMGKSLQIIIDDAIKNGYLDFNIKQIGDLNNVSDPNVVLIVANDLAHPFSHIDRIVKGYDKYITLNENDTVLFTEPYFSGTEKQEVVVANKIAEIGANVKMLSPKDSLLHHASKEDIKMMINLLNPKYYMPVDGEYRFQVMSADTAMETGFDKANIILKQNGEVVLFKNGNLADHREQLPADNVSIDGKSTMDVSELVLKDRDILGNNGLVMVATTIAKETKKLIHGPEISTRGFIYVKDNIDLIKELSSRANEIINQAINNNALDYNEIKKQIRDNLGKYIYNETECRPMIISVILEV